MNNFPKDHLRDDDQIELDSEVMGKDQSGDAMDLDKSKELGNASVEINAQDEAAKINGFDPVAEENASVDHVTGDTSTRDVVEDGIDESKNLDIDESKKGSAIDQVEVKETIASEDTGNMKVLKVLSLTIIVKLQMNMRWLWKTRTVIK